jgi:hypothetical protein
MTRRSITAVLGSLFVALFIAVNAPAVSADAPCILDNAGNCAAASGRDFTTQQIGAFDTLSATAPDATAASSGQAEDDAIRTALEMASAVTAPIAADLSGPASEVSEGMASSAWSK